MSNGNSKARLERWVEASDGTLRYESARVDEERAWRVDASAELNGVGITVSGVGDSMEAACHEALLRLDSAGITIPK